MTKTATFFYVAIVLITGVQVVATVFQTSSLAQQSKKVAQLQLQKRILLQEKRNLQLAIAQASALSEIAETPQFATFTSIKQPIVITPSGSVALTQL